MDDSVGAGDPRNMDPVVAAQAREMLQYSRRLIEVRRGCAALSIGLRSTLYVERNVLILLRSLIDNVAVVAFNNADAGTSVRVPLRGNSQIPDLIRDGLCDGLGFDALLGADQPIRIEEGCLNLDLPARSVVIYSAELSTAARETSLIQSLKQRHKNAGAQRAR